jgi:hypothetical protein
MENENEPSCYTYTCKSKTGLMPVGTVKYCSDCHSMLALHDVACEVIGVQPWDETFVIFRAGVIAGRNSMSSG